MMRTVREVLQTNLFKQPFVNGRVTGRPVPQEKADLYPLLIDPDQAKYSYWRYSRELKRGWEILIVRFIGYGSFNGHELVYCELPGGEKNEFGPFSLFPATQEEILQVWGDEALDGYLKLRSLSRGS